MFEAIRKMKLFALRFVTLQSALTNTWALREKKDLIKLHHKQIIGSYGDVRNHPSSVKHHDVDFAGSRWVPESRYRIKIQTFITHCNRFSSQRHASVTS